MLHACVRSCVRARARARAYSFTNVRMRLCACAQMCARDLVIRGLVHAGACGCSKDNLGRAFELMVVRAHLKLINEDA